MWIFGLKGLILYTLKLRMDMLWLTLLTRTRLNVTPNKATENCSNKIYNRLYSSQYTMIVASKSSRPLIRR